MRVPESYKSQSRWPVDFGYKTSWWIVRCDDIARVMEAIELRNVQPMPWQAGYEKSRSEGFFLPPPVGPWIFLLGAVPLQSENPRAIEKLRTLSERLGEAQLFTTHRVTDYHVWAKAVEGEFVRGFGYLGERGEVFFNEGAVTNEEQSLGIPWIDPQFSAPPPDDEDAWDNIRFPSETDVIKLAGMWSVDPTALSENPEANVGSGVWGEWCFLSEAPGPAKARKTVKLPKVQLISEVNLTTADKKQPLSKRKKPLFKDLAELLLKKDFERFRWALENGSSPNMKSDFGRTPLWAAIETFVEEGYYEKETVASVRLLLEHGADPNLPSYRGERPLHKAASVGSEEIVRLLLNAGAEIEGRDPDGATPLFYCRNVETAGLLLGAGANVHARDDHGRTALFKASAHTFSLLVEHGIDINAQSEIGNTAVLTNLHGAFGAGFVHELLDLGADPNIPNADGETVLSLAQKRIEDWRKELERTPDPESVLNWSAIAPDKIKELEALCQRLQQH